MGNRGSQEQEDSEGRCHLVSLCSPLPSLCRSLTLCDSYLQPLIYSIGTLSKKVSFCLLALWFPACSPSPSTSCSLSAFPPFPSGAQSVWVFDYI